MRYVLSAAAQDDIRDILGWTHERFGEAARLRYQALLATALRDLSHQPARPGSVERPELGPGVRSWHLHLSRERARTDTGMVRRPGHFVIYRVEAERILVGRVLHDAMELARHLDAGAPRK
ncbi:type II toxin-antitoxin system RelE/ParE family toxin [Alloalcanivorax marinus]|uniref:type II toxin-antitoxin system RelE/ParE family toxin n=1 Tax=Alloalcanivorax marinus TaxID=1177169 RepID=UPI0021CEA7C1|nr:type II toxin-antitoxin system RelE/ParE family toxin [Alloalcanivorax marinus]